jgi:hypothetical protein
MRRDPEIHDEEMDLNRFYGPGEDPKSLWNDEKVEAVWNAVREEYLESELSMRYAHS